ncbi:hypothetical protein BGW36DRAFT_428587 [Talaromyces proteolyticus]|uniref:Uncharacterized protein n=1 Tax=Talaromyces proteolyticus TaxID=1131652 RepID=A0AAD4KTI6_9EURO|nr:uncharacterized protein BGW36DRAFT_428587 [Talaromyces proteolyticus]KAH8696585.1 hypothetical protein BGW36DRAFT_428587 [Talaromyces proteolyticus]
MSVENFTYLRQLQQHQRQLHATTEVRQTKGPLKQLRPQRSSSAERPSSERPKIDLGARQVDRHSLAKRGLARIFIPAKLRRTKSTEDQNANLTAGIISHSDTGVGHDQSSAIETLHAVTSYNDTSVHSQWADVPSPPISPTSDQSSGSSAVSRSFPPLYSLSSTQMFCLCSKLLTNPFSERFELNPVLLNISHPLLSRPLQRRHCLRVLDLSGNGDSVYSHTIATLPYATVCQVPQRQREVQTQSSPSLPFGPKSFDVVSTRTLYKSISITHQPTSPSRPWSNEKTLESWIREIHRVLDNGGSFEYIFFERRLNNAGPLTREVEPFLYEEDQFYFFNQDQHQNSRFTVRENCTPCLSTTTCGLVTAVRFLELLANEGFTIEKNTTLMFPLSLLSTAFTQDGQRFRENRRESELDKPDVNPKLALLAEMVYEECRVSQTAWRCIIGCAQKT